MGQGKLVRDRIPEIIRAEGLEPVIYRADAEEYSARLRDKLQEEVAEFVASDNDSEEVADILEVLYALAEQAGTTREQLEKLRAVKAGKRGGFADRIIWSGNRPAELGGLRYGRPAGRDRIAAPRPWPPGPAGTGTSRTSSTGSATSPTRRTSPWPEQETRPM